MAAYDYNQTAVLRDVQVAQEIRSMAALGKFPKEITAYGLVYYQNGQRHYMLTTEQAKLVRFLNETANQALFPTLIDSHTERLAIPEGFEEDVIRAVKLQLAQKLAKDYPEQAFACLLEVSQAAPDSSAEEPLQKYRRQLESVFDAEKIRAFAAICTQAYLRKNCTLAIYQELSAWCAKRLLQLEGFVPPVGQRDKSFYGLAVLKDQHLERCVINANLSCIYQEKLALEQQGLLTTIWHQHHFAVPKQESLSGIQAQMTAILEKIYDTDLIALMEQIEQAPAVIEPACFAQVMETLTALGEKAAALGAYYGQRWGLQGQQGRENHGV